MKVEGVVDIVCGLIVAAVLCLGFVVGTLCCMGLKGMLERLPF